MTTDDIKRFNSMMCGLCDVYGKEATPFLLKAYFETLKDLSIEEIEKAAIKYMQQPETASRFMPKPGNLREMIFGNSNDAAAFAWKSIVTAIRTYGAYRSVAFDDPIIHIVVSHLGGWPALCHTTNDELPFVEARFCKHYVTIRHSGETLAAPSHLAGIVEMENARKGFANEPIVKIGNKKIIKEKTVNTYVYSRQKKVLLEKGIGF